MEKVKGYVKSNVKKAFGIFLIILICLILCAGYSEKMSDDITKSGIVRLHIIANSNETEDQLLKLSIKDALISAGVFDEKTKTVDFCEIYEICKRKTKEFGKTYGARCETGKFYFPTKSYENIRLPAGEYNALRVVLGEGEGENWWCVMYPPLCFSESTMGKMSKENEEKLGKMMSEPGFNLVTSQEITIEPAFYAVELWQEIKQKIKNIDG